MPAEPVPGVTAIVPGGGDMGARIRAHDWSATPFGAPSTWPQSLRSALSICLTSSIVSALYWGPEFRILYNDAYAPALGVRHPQALGQPVCEVWAEIWDVLGPQLVSVIETGEGFATDRQRLMMHRHGYLEETFWFYSFAPVRGEGGDILGVFVNAMDITAQVAGERALQKSEEALRDLNATLATQIEARTQERDRIWNVSQDLFGVADSNGSWLSVNPAFTRITGWEPDCLIGRTSEWLEHPDDREKTRAEIHALSVGRTTFNFENRWLRQNGSYCHLSWTAVLLDGLLYCVARDITEENDRKKTLLQTEEALRQAQKMEAIGQLTGGIAHDFNNLLTGVIGSVDLVGRFLATNRLDDVQRFLNTASTAAHRAAALTNRLLAFARRQSLDAKSTDVNELVASVEDMLQRTLGKEVGLQVTLADGLWLATLDANQLENAVLNLAINARDAMPDGGQLTIETTNTHLDENYTRHQDDVAVGDYVAISVSDTGTGMPPDVIAQAFEPFFTTKPIGAGTGLGLSMIYGFIKQSRGHVRIYSEMGNGTTVQLYLPRAVTDVTELTTTGKIETPQGDGETILVVEDDATVRLLITSELDELGYQFVEASNATTALALLRSRMDIDLLITDVGLPVVNGRQLAEIARQLRPNLRVLFVTGYAEAAMLRGNFLAEGMDMLTKPFALNVLGSKISNIISRKMS